MFKVLLVDDEYIVREALKVVLGEIGNVTVVGEAVSGIKALEMVESAKPDMIFLDIKIPGIDILYLIKHMKRLNSKSTIILLTDYGSYEFVFKALEVGGDEYLLKPYHRKDIYHLVNLHLSHGHLKAENLDQGIEQLIKCVYKEDISRSKDLLKMISQQINSLFGEDTENVRNIAGSIIQGLEIIGREKGIFLLKKVNWSDQLRGIDRLNFESILSSILDELFEAMMDSHSIHEKKVIQSVLNYIEENYQKGLTLEEVAEYVHLSPFYLSKLFKKELKINFVNYVTERKMEKAKELLESTDMPILNIALELNYQEANYFSKVFKKVVGMTPTEFRKKNENDHQYLLKKNNSILNGNWYV